MPNRSICAWWDNCVQPMFSGLFRCESRANYIELQRRVSTRNSKFGGICGVYPVLKWQLLSRRERGLFIARTRHGPNRRSEGTWGVRPILRAPILSRVLTQ